MPDQLNGGLYGILAGFVITLFGLFNVNRRIERIEGSKADKDLLTSFEKRVDDGFELVYKSLDRIEKHLEKKP